MPLVSWQVCFLESIHCFVSFLLAKAWVSVGGAGHEASPILIATCAGQSSPVPPASPRCCPAPPLVLGVLPGPQRPSPASEVQSTPERLGTSPAKHPLV